MTKNGEFVFAKLSQRLASDLLGGKKRLKELNTILQLHVKWKPQVNRGKKRTAPGSYTLDGWHKDPSGNDLVCYSWKSGTPQEVKDRCQVQFQKFEYALERACLAISNGMVEKAVMQDVKELIELPAAAAPPAITCRKRIQDYTEDLFGTALALGQDYWSPVHTDKDMHFTAVTFIGPPGMDKKDFDKEIHNFCFPEFKIRVPMRAGEILIFNPVFQHCCSNPRFQQSFSASNYTSLATVRERASQHLQNLN